MRGYRVEFRQLTKGWKWFIYYNTRRMAESSKFYKTKKSAVRSFWSVMSDGTLDQIEENYAGGVAD